MQLRYGCSSHVWKNLMSLSLFKLSFHISVGVGSLLPFYERFRGLNLGHQTWQQSLCPGLVWMPGSFYSRKLFYLSSPYCNSCILSRSLVSTATAYSALCQHSAEAAADNSWVRVSHILWTWPEIGMWLDWKMLVWPGFKPQYHGVLERQWHKL